MSKTMLDSFELLLLELSGNVDEVPDKLKKEVRHTIIKVQHCRDYYKAQVLDNLPKEKPEGVTKKE